MTTATTTTRRRLFTELFKEALQQQHCIIALHCNANNIEAALQQNCNATTTTTTTTTTRRSIFTEALQQQHCHIALHCYCNNIEAALQQHCDATPTTTTTTSTTISRLFLVLLFEALALRIVALALTSRVQALLTSLAEGFEWFITFADTRRQGGGKNESGLSNKNMDERYM